MVFRTFTLYSTATLSALGLTAFLGGPMSSAVLAPGDRPAFELAQTNGMNRRDDRRDTRQDRRGDRQDCRQDEGVVGRDKRDCKQDARHGNDEEATTQPAQGN